jgi:uncharacterized membrane protein YgaE (UPF0421/DUF939 family)
MAKLKDHIIKQEEHRQLVLERIEKEIEINRRVKRVANKQKHQLEKHQSTQTWSEDMPDLEGEALADAERQFDYDRWLGEHGIGE